MLLSLSFLVTLLFCSKCSVASTVNLFPLLMPDVQPTRVDSYFCTPIRIDDKTDYYITGFHPNASSDVAHHMLLFGCSSPGSSKSVWNCGEMALADPSIDTAPVCGSGSQVMYGWAKDAPKLDLPEGVGFHVGQGSDVKYLVLQVHYAQVDSFKDGKTDDSGVMIQFTKDKQPKSAGVLLLGTGGRIMPNSVEYMESACTINQDIVLHPFAFRTHTHSLGRVVSGYKVTRKGEMDYWELIGKKDPQLPQMFYPTDAQVVLRKGDRVAARCTMKSDRDRVTRVGSTNDDEMCNFYMMYWTEGTDLTQKSCFTLGPPFYGWGRDGLNNIPDIDASSLPVGTSAKELKIKSHQA